MINLGSITNLVNYKPTYIKFIGYKGGDTLFTVRLLVSSRLISVNYKGCCDKELLNNINKFEYLKELDYSSYNEMRLNSLPRSLNTLRLGYHSLALGIMDKNEKIVYKCCTENKMYLYLFVQYRIDLS